jgi:hypothetical protein
MVTRGSVPYPATVTLRTQSVCEYMYIVLTFLPSHALLHCIAVNAADENQKKN